MAKPKVWIGLGIVAIFAVSTVMAVAANPLQGIAAFFVLTVLLWAVARIRHWI